MNPIVSHTVYCQYCMTHFTEKTKALAVASRNAHEEVCRDNQDSTNRGKNEQA